jgi:alanine-synthesizing transaminase
VATIGSKEGLAHLALAVIGTGDVVLTPSPTYPIHAYSVIIAGGDMRSVPLLPGVDFFSELEKATMQIWPRPKLLILNFPHNPTTAVVDRDFFVKVVAFAREHDMMVVHDLAYADIVFDGYQAPSFLEVPGAKEVGVEFFTLSKSYNMPGWRVGFAVGNKRLIGALTRIKSYLDYGIFQPVQIAAIIALNESQECVKEVCNKYRSRRDILIESFGKAGWKIEKPRATMFVWARIPEQFKKMGSLEFSKLLLKEAKVAVSPGIGFGEYGDGYVRLALVENEQRIRQAAKGVKRAFDKMRNKVQSSI